MLEDVRDVGAGMWLLAVLLAFALIARITLGLVVHALCAWSGCAYRRSVTTRIAWSGRGPALDLL